MINNIERRDFSYSVMIRNRCLHFFVANLAFNESARTMRREKQGCSTKEGGASILLGWHDGVRLNCLDEGGRDVQCALHRAGD